jgi:hypothetical protein
MLFLLSPWDQYFTFPHGLEGKYYANSGWQGDPQFVTIDSDLSRTLLKKYRKQFTENQFSAEWNGFIMIEKAGRYTFATASDDGSDLYVNHQRVVDNGGFHGLKEVTNQVYLEAGVYPIRIRYFQSGGRSHLSISWARENQSLKVLPSYILSPYPFSVQDYKFRRGLDYGILFLKWIWSGTLVYLIRPYVFRWVVLHQRFFLSYQLNGALIFFIVFTTHFKSEVMTPFDSRWSIYTAMSLIKEGNANLDEYFDILLGNDFYVIQRFNDHFYTMYPIGVPVLAVPFVFILDQVLMRLVQFDLENHIKQFIPAGIELFIACFIVALTAVFIYLIARLFLDNMLAWLLVLIFAFCTSSWSTASRALWQHGPSMLMLTITLYLILLAKNKPFLIQFASIPLTFSYMVRPTNSLSVLLVSIFVLIQYRRYFLPYLLWSMPVAVPFLHFNWTIYHSLFSYYYRLPQELGTNSHFFEALLANLISPARGLFVFSPILLFSLYGIVLKFKNKQWETLDYFLLSIIVLHGLSISYFSPSRNWWGGHSFGPRLFSDMIPYFVYFLIPAMIDWPHLKARRKVAFTSVFFCLLIISFFIHYSGATRWNGYNWNGDPTNIDLYPERLWDWKDAQFLRGLGQ